MPHGLWPPRRRVPPSRWLACEPQEGSAPACRSPTSTIPCWNCLRRLHRHRAGWRSADSISSHMASYADIDIALDPTPYGGVITTLEAVWMGVPVVTMAGDRVLGRYSHAFVSVLGLPHLTAIDEDDYVAKAVMLAADEAGRAALRGGLRDRMRTSPLCDGRAMAASI